MDMRKKDNNVDCRLITGCRVALCLSLFFAAALSFFLVLSASSYAQPDGAAEAASPQEAEQGDSSGEVGNEIDPNKIPSLFFTYWEHAALLDAKRARGDVRPPTEAELRARLPDDGERPRPPPEERELKLGGIVYVTGDEWTIWLNKMRITPEAVPPEVLDLEVFEEYIEIKWHDDYTGQIFPIRLRPHQRFNFDMRIFLPG